MRRRWISLLDRNNLQVNRQRQGRKCQSCWWRCVQSKSKHSEKIDEQLTRCLSTSHFLFSDRLAKLNRQEDCHVGAWKWENIIILINLLVPSDFDGVMSNRIRYLLTASNLSSQQRPIYWWRTSIGEREREESVSNEKPTVHCLPSSDVSSGRFSFFLFLSSSKAEMNEWYNWLEIAVSDLILSLRRCRDDRHRQ